VDEFDWDDANIKHIAIHNVRWDEVEQAFTDPRRRPIQAYNTPTERRYGMIGATEDNRVLVIVYARRDGAIRPISARDADRDERRRYRRKK
jgi:uncharacterized protein